LDPRQFMQEMLPEALEETWQALAADMPHGEPNAESV